MQCGAVTTDNGIDYDNGTQSDRYMAWPSEAIIAGFLRVSEEREDIFGWFFNNFFMYVSFKPAQDSLFQRSCMKS